MSGYVDAEPARSRKAAARNVEVPSPDLKNSHSPDQRLEKRFIE